MADLIKIKAGNGAVPVLQDKEIAYSRTEKALYIGADGGNVRLCGANDHVMLQTLNATISGLQAAITGINATIEAINIDIQTITARLGEIETDIQDITARLTALETPSE